MKTTPSLRSLLALSAATALLLTGCGGSSDETGASGPTGGQRPGVLQIDDEPSDSPGLVDPAGETDSPDGQPDQQPDDQPDDQPDESDDQPAADLGEFPLAAGWPDDVMEPHDGGLTMPVDDLASPFAEVTCHTPAPTPDTTDALRAEFTDVEAYLSRELLVFGDADAAVAYVSGLDAFYATDACSGQDVPGGEATYPLFRVDTGVGGQSFAIGRGTSYEGEPQIGMSALHVVRVGRSVLLDHTSGEGFIGSDADARELAASMTDRAADVVAAQCAFTDAGC